MWGRVKEFAIEQVLWAEKNLKRHNFCELELNDTQARDIADEIADPETEEN